VPPSPNSLPSRLTKRDVAIGLVLALAAFLVYNANLRSIAAIDTYGARHLPLSIWRNHTLTLDPIAREVAQGRAIASFGPDAASWVRQGRSGHLVSLYPIAVPVVVAPLYYPVVAHLNAQGWDPHRVERLERVMEKLSASILAAATVVVVYLLLRRRSEPSLACALAVVFAFGTTTWAISSQALWMHGLGGLLVAATMLVLTGRATAARAFSAGFLCAAIVCNRQPDVVLAVALALYGLWWARHRPLALIAGAVIPLGLVIAYNWTLVGNLLGAYAAVEQRSVSAFLDHDPLEGVLGLLVSPTRGLFVFSPFLLFVPLGIWLAFRDPRWRGFTALAASAAALQIIGYSFGDWRQGSSYGPRWLTDMLPILFWMLPPIVARLSRLGRSVFGAACVVAIAIQAIGAFWYTGAADVAVFAPNPGDPMRAAWEFRNAPFVAELQHAAAPRDLFSLVRGNIDLVRPFRDQNGENPRVELTGWALADDATPANVAVRVDGRLLAGTPVFVDRPDVNRTLGVASPSGWRIVLPARVLQPGALTVSAMVRAQAGGEQRLLVERKVTLTAADTGHWETLEQAMTRASQVLAESQQQEGYWLTQHTTGTVFVSPGVEMDTFSNATMIDLLDPIAGKAGLADDVARARRFLSTQIEANGLVRYHGLPDAPTIGRLGCAITPDADDTALVWRVTGADAPERLRSALATLAEFRTSEGLYRTWLAPRDQYRCIDPGHDPNPADLGIQINVLLFLAKADPPAAQALCAALRRHIGEDDRWFYYAQAPLLPAARANDLAEAGCAIDLPQSRLQTPVPGQDDWMRAAALLMQLEKGGAPRAASIEARRLLDAIAADDFATVAKSPPLIYQNDATGTVKRFYWSKSIGFALWLRLYFASGV
jgi:hypothetical protein